MSHFFLSCDQNIGASAPAYILPMSYSGLISYRIDWFDIFTVQGTQESSLAAAAAAKSLQSCLTLCNSIDSSPPGSAVPGILQARTLEWVAISFSNA